MVFRVSKIVIKKEKNYICLVIIQVLCPSKSSKEYRIMFCLLFIFFWITFKNMTTSMWEIITTQHLTIREIISRVLLYLLG